MYYSPRVKKAMEKLLDMPNFSLTLRLMDKKVEETLLRTIRGGGKSVKRVKLKNNAKEEPKGVFINSLSETKRKRDEFLLEMMHGRIKRSTHDSVTRKSKGSESFSRIENPVYWFSGPLVRTDYLEKFTRSIGIGKEKFSQVRQMALNKHVLHGLPDNFSWCLQYFASYAQISNVSLLQELSDIENLILHLDKDYFGYMKSKTPGKRERK